jgi:hypothetical protein
MAISTYIVGMNTANAGSWTPEDALFAIGIGLSWAQQHGAPVSGLAVGVATFSGGGAVNATVDSFYKDVSPITTSGIGTGVSLWIERESDLNGAIDGILVNRPGYGYTGGEVVTISAEDIGGAANGASDITVQLIVDATIPAGASYAVTATDAGGNNHVSEGYDINGYQGISSGLAYTIYEGDTLQFTNSTGSESSGYDDYYLTNKYASSFPPERDKVTTFGITGLGNGETRSWTPKWGERGTYWLIRQYYSHENVEEQIVVNVLQRDSAGITSVSYGSTTEFMNYSTYQYGTAVWKQDINPNKKYGTTYHFLAFDSSYNLYCAQTSGYHPTDHTTCFPNWTSNGDPTTSVSYKGHKGRPYRSAGSKRLDLINGTYDIHQDANSYRYGWISNNSSSWTYTNNMTTLCTLNTNYTSFELRLRVWRSGIDPNFVVFGFDYPTVSAGDIDGNTTTTWFWHNFESNVFDLDKVFLGGATTIGRFGSYDHGASNQPYMDFTCNLVPSISGKRAALRGYCSESYGGETIYDRYKPTIISHDAHSSTTDVRMYFRPESGLLRFDEVMKDGDSNVYDEIDPSVSANNIIKNLPLNSRMMPCPYYLPDDFGIIQFEYNQIYANIQRGDRVTISGSEVWEVIDGSYDTNESSRTTGILFCGRVV